MDSVFKKVVEKPKWRRHIEDEKQIIDLGGSTREKSITKSILDK